MDIATERSKIIEDWIKDPSREVKELKAQVLIDGQNQYLEVYRIPVEYLVYNIRNGRFAAELLKVENDLNRKLDANNKDDAKILQNILLNQNAEETGDLKKDLQDHGQLYPGLVTFDGAVINANRRMAILSQLYTETGKEIYRYLKVAILPKHVTQKDLWRIEAGLQFAKDFRLDYGPVNELLKLRDGIRSGLTPKIISNYLGGRYTEDDIKDRLKVLGLIDSYLESVNKRGQYIEFKGERIVEKFISLSNVVNSLTKKASKKKAADVIPVGFQLIESGNVNYLGMRKLKDIMMNEKAHGILTTNFNPTINNMTTRNDLVDRFHIAEEIVETEIEQDKPRQLVERALAIIEGIDASSSASMKDQELIKSLEKLKEKVGVLLVLLTRTKR